MKVGEQRSRFYMSSEHRINGEITVRATKPRGVIGFLPDESETAVM